MNGTEYFRNGTEYFKNGTELFINSSFFSNGTEIVYGRNSNENKVRLEGTDQFESESSPFLLVC